MIYFLIIVINIMLLATSVMAAGVSILKVDVGARAAGMGGAFVAVADDISSIWCNPAGLSRIKSEEIAIHHQDWLQDTSYECLGYAYPVKNLTLGISLNYLICSNIPEVLRDVNGEPLTTGRLFNTSDSFGMFAISKQVNESLSIGGGIKYIQEQLDNKKATAGSFDFGCLYIPKDFCRIALSLQNIGTRMQFDSDEFSLPMMYRMGMACITESSVVGVEFNKARDRGLRGSAGVELKINDPIAIRWGYLFLTDNDHGSFKGIPDRVSLGFGVKIGNTNMDYAFASYGVLRDTHRISVSTKFGQQRSVGNRGMTESAKGIRIEGDSSKDVVIVTTDNIPLREGPGTNYSIIAKIEKGTRLKIIDKKKKIYYEVVLPDGRRGWVCSVFVE